MQAMIRGLVLAGLAGTMLMAAAGDAGEGVSERRASVQFGGGRLAPDAGATLRGERHGKGVMTWPDGRRYEGEFREGDLNGQGVMISSAGKRYEGEFKRSYVHGSGVVTWSDGRRYEGEWIYGAPTVQGVMACSDGRRYEGEFYGAVDLREKSGRVQLKILHEPNTRRYGGKFYVSATPHGQGVATWPDGRRYEGRFQEGEFHADGVTVSPDGPLGDWCA